MFIETRYIKNIFFKTPITPIVISRLKFLKNTSGISFRKIEKKTMEITNSKLQQIKRF